MAESKTQQNAIFECECSAEEIIFLPCSGGSNCGQIANQVAVKLDEEGGGNIYCLAGVSAHIEGMVESAKGAKRIMALDGCQVACAKHAIEHAMNPRNLRDLADASGFGRVTGPCGDTIEIWLRVKDGIVADATFLTDGCGSAIASGSMPTELVKGRSIAEALKISQQDVLKALDGLPEESAHCALLAVNTLKETIKDYITFKNEPWKRAYRKH